MGTSLFASMYYNFLKCGKIHTKKLDFSFIAFIPLELAMDALDGSPCYKANKNIIIYKYNGSTRIITKGSISFIFL